MVAGTPRLFAIILAYIAVLNTLDLFFTRRALALGAVEGNPVMALLFDDSMVLAAVLKLGVGFLVVFFLWRLRRYRRVAEFAIVTAAAFVVLFGYHLYVAARLT